MERSPSFKSNKFDVNPAPLSERVQKSAKDIKVFPSDFIHGLLSAHVAEETGFTAGKCQLLENSKVFFKTDNNLHKEFLTNKNININELLNNWFIEKIIDNEQTGYCGIVYKNILTQNLILAHRSTNFKLGFGSNFFKQSGVQADYQSVLLGILVPHMAFGHQATKVAIEVAKKLNYTLSITGHSLGAFLAEMSIYYCYHELDFKYVKAIVFDGPGSWDLMNLLNINIIKNSVNMILLEQLDIVSYITAPNLVNCCNSRVGKVFTIFPKLEKDLGIYSQIIKNFGEKYDSGLCTTIYGHDLLNILPYFDPDSGRPYECELVVRWPKISHKDYGQKRDTKSIASTIIKTLFASGPYDLVLGFFNLFIREEKVLNTVESIVLVLQDFLLGKIDLKQFWNVHKLINIDNDFRKPKNLNPQEEFNLIYTLNYQIKPYNIHETTLNDKNDDIDRFLKLTKEKEESLKSFMASIEMLVPFWDYYNYYQGLNEIKINENFRKEVSVHDLRDYMRFLLLKKPDLLNKLTSVSKPILPAKTDNLIKINFLKNNLKILCEIIEKERVRYPKEEDYQSSLKSELNNINKFMNKKEDDLIYKYQMILFGQTNSGKSTLGSKLLLNDEKKKIFPTAAIAETCVPCTILVNEELEKATIQIKYEDQEQFSYEADSLEGLIDIVNKTINKESISTNDKIIQDAVIQSPRSFFPRVKSGTIVQDLPGFSENDKMKQLNISQLTKEKNRSIILFLISLERGGSLMQENVEILSAYKTEEIDLSSNIVFVFTKLRLLKILCENCNPEFSDEELLEHLNKTIQRGFVLPLKEKYPSARIIFYEIGKEMEKLSYDKDTLYIFQNDSKDPTDCNLINVKEETLSFLDNYINEQFEKNQDLYMDHLKNKVLTSVNRVQHYMIEFHSQDNIMDENKKNIQSKLTEFTEKTKGERVAEFKKEIFNASILQEIIDKHIKEDNYKNGEKCLNTVEAEVHSIIKNFLVNVSYLLEDEFYENLFFYVMRDLPSDKQSVEMKVMKMREEILQFLGTSKTNNSQYNFLKKIAYFFTRYIPKLWRSELYNFKLQVYDKYSVDYWMNGKEITEFFDRIIKKLPGFVNLIGVQYRKKEYCGKSNDLYHQAEQLLESINKGF